MAKNQPHLHTSVQNIPNFFYASLKNIIFMYNGQEYKFSKIRTNIYAETLAKMLEGGINHFLTYYWMTDRDMYYLICEDILRTYFSAFNETQVKMNDGVTYQGNRVDNLKKWCVLNPFLLQSICRYVKDLSVDSIDNKSATTNITLDNVHCSILSCIAVAVKFSYVYASLMLGTMTFDDALVLFIDELTLKIIEEAGKIWDIGDSDTAVRDLHSYIDAFIFERVDNLWLKNSEKSFRNKFEEVGRDRLYYAGKNKIAVYYALKQYFPPLLHADLIPKYADPDTKLFKIYYTVEKDWQDFKFVNTNLASYIQQTLEKIIRTQDTSSVMPDVNTPDFIVGQTDENFELKDRDELASLYDDYKLKSIPIFKMFIDETARTIAEFDLPLLGQFTSKINLNPKHYLNRFIADKILLCLTGSCRIYRMIYGSYLRMILFLFWIKLKTVYSTDEKFAWMNTFIDAMMMDPVPATSESLESITKFLTDEGEKATYAKGFERICKRYADNDGNAVNVTKEELLDFYEFLSDPFYVRNFLFPLRYDLEEDDDHTRFIDNKQAKPEYIDKARKILIGIQ